MVVGNEPTNVVIAFNDAVNRRDLNGLVALMTEDHVFVDSAGNEIRGRAAVRSAWEKFFAAFPDYKNVFMAVSCRGSTVNMRGHSSCSEPALSGPALWTAEVRDGLVTKWRVSDDSEENRAALGF